MIVWIRRVLPKHAACAREGFVVLSHMAMSEQRTRVGLSLTDLTSTEGSSIEYSLPAFEKPEGLE
jgi:hypothetical protein